MTEADKKRGEDATRAAATPAPDAGKKAAASEKGDSATGRFAFLDPLARLFRGREEPAKGSSPQQQASQLDAMFASFDSAVEGLEKKIAEARSASASAARGAGAGEASAEQRAAASQHRMEQAHQAMLEDVEKMHARLGTELSGANLVELATELQAMHADVAAGKDSHSLLPRMRYTIMDRVVKETGELAVTRLLERLQREKMSWPDPTCYRPSATPEEIERSQRRRLAEIREAFLGQDLERTAERVVGIVRGWKSDYPDRGSPLWEDCVLQCVAAGIRGQLVKQAVDQLRQDRELILQHAQASIGKELGAIQSALEGGVHSLEQANRAVAGSLGVLDQIVPEIAWKHVQAQLAGAASGAPAPSGQSERERA
ncbi:MAG TPA: hypothetical protein VEC18_04960 [Myxococcota bacterium]|nr:hypothetical protein [Myxococcota bacterium]